MHDEDALVLSLTKIIGPRHEFGPSCPGYVDFLAVNS
jgi:hypothetical protein